jgi:predicted metal-binding membrane protein
MAEAWLEAPIRRDTAIVAGALALLIALAWLSVLAGGGTGMDPMAMTAWRLPLEAPAGLSGSWSPLYWALTFVMWATMMVAMMLPSASPMILLYARVVRAAEARGSTARAPLAIAAFATGYVLLWSLFSVFAAGLQWLLEQSDALSAMMTSRSSLLSGGLLIAAGLYQLTSFKRACLDHCRAPAAFLSAHWRPGLWGACRMGLEHGAYCVGCCLLLMLLLFVGGIMNLMWIAGLTLYVTIEKLAPFGEAAAKAIALILMAAGGALLVAA